MKRLEDIILLIEDRLIDRIGKLLDDKGALSGNITRTELRATMRQVYLEGRRAGEASLPRCTPSVVGEDEDFDPQFHTWADGSMHRLPHDYVLTSLGTATSSNRAQTAMQAYLRWNFADRSRRICAIRCCHT